MLIEFNDETHICKVDGIFVPTVTQVIQDNFESNLSFVDPWVLERATRFGRFFHKAAHLIDLEMLDESSIDPGLVSWLDAYKKFKLENVDRFLAMEELCYNKDLRVSGTPDRIAVMKDGSIAVLEYKTSSGVSKTWRLQTAGYQHISDLNATRRIIIKFTKDGFKIIEHKDETDKDAFIWACFLTKWRLNNKLYKGKTA